MLLYECAPKSRQVPLLEKASSERGAACYSPAMPPEWDSCLTPIVAWAVGSQGTFNLPKNSVQAFWISSKYSHMFLFCFVLQVNSSLNMWEYHLERVTALPISCWKCIMIIRPWGDVCLNFFLLFDAFTFIFGSFSFLRIFFCLFQQYGTTQD